ncbi:hypothetical protein GF340_04280 [Candidatus Peregrinibacteria bacterium]|nr:hypothetical protein [Candidatus Peregrinibacteria bacterium]
MELRTIYSVRNFSRKKIWQKHVSPANERKQNISRQKKGSIGDEPIFYLDYQIIVDYLIYKVLSSNGELDEGSMEEFADFVEAKYGRDHWLFTHGKLDLEWGDEKVANYLLDKFKDYRYALSSKIINRSINFKDLPIIVNDFYRFGIVSIQLSDKINFSL